MELNLDGLVGPTHNYAGLAYGNLASLRHRLTTSNPRAAALEGLAKMKFLADLGVPQAVLPPHDRPDLAGLRRLGFTGSDPELLQEAYREAPHLLAACASASSMWAANAATVCPSADSHDQLVHFTPANLVSQFHRSLESATTADVLGAIFADPRYFVHHGPLPAAAHFSDEGAANHTRLCPRGNDGAPGLHLFVYGRSAFQAEPAGPRQFPARQTAEASQAIARLHRIPTQRAIFLRQNPAAIDAGAFHNDVVAVGNQDVLLCHAAAYESPRAIDEVRRSFAQCCGGELTCLVVTEQELSLAEAVDSYLFNSQLVTLASGQMALIAPEECRQMPRAAAAIERLMSEGGRIRQVHYVQVRQSMRNGGGPACLRLRVPLSHEQLAAMHGGVRLTNGLYERLVAWVNRHYRQELSLVDLPDPRLLEESRAALDELTRLLGLGSLYGFQRI